MQKILVKEFGPLMKARGYHRTKPALAYGKNLANREHRVIFGFTRHVVDLEMFGSHFTLVFCTLPDGEGRGTGSVLLGRLLSLDERLDAARLNSAVRQKVRASMLAWARAQPDDGVRHAYETAPDKTPRPEDEAKMPNINFEYRDEEDVQRIVAFLRPRLPLVLDAFEQLVDGAPEAGRCPTSR